MNTEEPAEVPVVSVSLITYNHAPYIGECLDSVLAQQTDFPFEIVLGEDESTDGTRAICRDYARRHPGVIRLIERSQSDPGREAYLSQGVYNYIETTKVCAGEYVAICDGDDAWSDPLKLQKQYDVARADPSIALVHSDYQEVDGVTGRLLRRKTPRPRGLESSNTPEFRRDVILRDYVITASTVFARLADLLNVFEKREELFKSLPMGDLPSWVELLNHGSFHFMDESLVIYRQLPASDSNTSSAERKYRFSNGTSNLGLWLGDEYHLPMERIRAEKVKNCNRYALLSGDRSEIERLRADPDFVFNSEENALYLLGRTRMTRAIAKRLFELRFHIMRKLMRLV